MKRRTAESDLGKRVLERAKAIHQTQHKRKPVKKPLSWVDGLGQKHLTEHGRREQTKKIRKQDALDFSRELSRARREVSW